MSKWGYREVRGPRSGRRPNGMHLEHRVKAAQMLGRSLLPKEVVHHRDDDRRNNHKRNLMVFSSQGDHARFHKGGMTVKLENGSYACDKERHPCGRCGASTPNRRYCSYQCAEIGRRKVSRPTKAKLKKDIQSMSWVALGKKYGVSDNAVRKWARSCDLL